MDEYFANDMAHVLRRRRTFMGLDQQGRIQPAEAATEIGHDDDALNAAKGCVLAVIVSLAIWAIAAWIALR